MDRYCVSIVPYHKNRFVQRVIVRIPRTLLFMSNSVDVSRKEEDAYPTDASGPSSKLLVESKLHIFFCFFLRIIFAILCCLLCLSVFHVWSLSMDCVIWISARILVPLFTLSLNSLNILIICAFYTTAKNLSYYGIAMLLSSSP